MSDNHRESNEGGFQLNTDGLNCLTCKCRRKTFHKETKINNNPKIYTVGKILCHDSLYFEQKFVFFFMENSKKTNKNIKNNNNNKNEQNPN